MSIVVAPLESFFAAPALPPEPPSASEPHPESRVRATTAVTSAAHTRSGRVMGTSIKWYGRQVASWALSESHEAQECEGRGSLDERAAARERPRSAGRR